MANSDAQQKIVLVKAALELDLEACDLKWTLFVAAAQSYRFDSRLTPYPSKYKANQLDSSLNERFDIESILRSIQSVPTLYSISWPDLTEEAIDLLYWVLCVQTESLTIRSIPKEKFAKVLSKVVSDCPTVQPTHIFELVPLVDSLAEQKFKAQFDSVSKSLFAFHGSKIDSFHSIVNHGLQQHLCKTALFGDGIYLSSEMHVSLPFSPVASVWKHSQLGDEMSCIALCEFVDHPVHLKRHATDNNRGSVPEKYFVITNNDIVRVRYLLICASTSSAQSYARSNNSLLPRSVTQPTRPPSRLWLWLVENKATIAIFVYTIILLLIGFGSSRTGMYWRHIAWTKCERFIESWSLWKIQDEKHITGIPWPTIRAPEPAEL